MKSLFHSRVAAVRVLLAALVLLGGVSAWVSASSLPKAGYTGQALAARALIHPSLTATRPAFWADHSRLPNGRYLMPYASGSSASRRPEAASNANPIIVNEGVQTYDVFAPPPSFTPQADLPLNATNLTPVWSPDESYIVFSSNLGADGHFHIYAVAANGNTQLTTSATPTLYQITSGTGNEFFPTLDATGSSLAFTSDANSPGNQQLYVIGGQSGVSFAFTQGAVNVGTLATNSRSSKTLGNTGFVSVAHPTWSPGGDALAFAATTLADGHHTAGVSHIYFLYTSTNGYQQTTALGTANPPVQLTDGPASDTDPAWSPGGTGGNFIAFASTATSVASTGNPYGPTTSPSVTTGTGSVRGLFLLSGTGAASAFGSVPAALSSVGGRVDNSGVDDFGPAWSFPNANSFTNPNNSIEYLTFARASSAAGNHDIYFFPVLQRNSATNQNLVSFTPETTGAAGTAGANPSVQLNTSDSGNAYDDAYPAWAPFESIFSIVYQSPRSVTYNAAGNVPSETAISVGRGTSNVGAAYSGLLVSQVLNLDPPSLLRYSGNEVIHIANAAGATTKSVQPSQTVTFVVRLSDREANIDSNNVYLQIKDPDSKYQDAQGLEHKVFSNCNDVDVANNTHLNSGSSSRLWNGGADGTAIGGFSQTYEFNNGGFAGFNIINNAKILQNGAVGGVDGNDTIAVGHTSDDPEASIPPLDPPTSTNLRNYRPWGPEYEAQFINPQYASQSGGGDTDPSNPSLYYGVPYYLAGFDDQNAFSGFTHPARPTTNTPADTTTTPTTPAKPAEWLQLSPLPAAQQDNQGGVLYGVTWTTPATPSDFYLDVIAYDNAVFPALPAGTSTFVTEGVDFNGNPIPSSYTQASKNWRIYDNVGGFTTQTFDGSNDILVVSDYALGQKFAATTFGGRTGNANLQPTFYGAESYYTDVDVSLLPNATDLNAKLTAPVAPPIPPQQNTPFPTQFTATPSTASITLEWAGDFAPNYNIYRSTTPNPTFPADFTLLATVPGTTAGIAQTSYNDANLVNGTTYYYVITSVNANNNESQPGTAPDGVTTIISATPAAFGGTVHFVQMLSLGGGAGFVDADLYPNVENGLGVGSYDDGQIDDGSTLQTPGANTPAGIDEVPFVRSQRYSLWRILARGPVPSTVLAGYQPSFVSQPAIADGTNNVNQAAAANIPVANRCVIWVAPYAGNLPLIDAGSLENPTTQQTLQSYVNAGGRLCVSGANVASALSLKGTVNNAFLTNTLGGDFATQAGGGQVLASNTHRLTGNPGFNGGLGYYSIATGNGVTSQPVSSGALLLGSDYTTTPNWRTDGSLDQLGPNVTPVFSNGGNNEVVAQINTIKPSANATTDTTTNGASGLIYHEDYASALGSGYGSRVVFSSFGLEGIGIEYFKFTANKINYYAPRNQRPKLLHNIVCYLRTGSFTGRITQASGLGVANATVYLRPNGGTPPGPVRYFSTTTGFDGSYRINGVEPGSYSVVSYKSGFTTTASTLAYGVEGDSTTNINLVISPVPPGQISGTVTDSITGVGVPNVSVTFVSTDGQTTVTGVTGPDGTYSIDNVPAGTYNGTASKQPQYVDATAPTQGNPVTVTSGAATTANFSLVANPAVVSGNVFQDLNGDNQFNPNSGEGIAGATLTFTPSTGTAPAPVTSGADGAYTISLPPGTFTITVSAPGFVTNSSQTITVQAGTTVTRYFQLSVAPPVIPGFLGGLVTNSFDGTPISGATITITGTTLTAPVTITSSGTTTSPNAPTGDGQPLNYGPQSLPPGTYTVTVSAPGYTTPAPVTTTISASAFTRVDFTSANGNPLAPIHVFGAGYNFFSVPYDYAAAGVSFNQLFGPLNTGTFNPFVPSPSNANRSHVFVWNPVLGQYVLDPAPPADGAHLGQGYWVFLHSAYAVTVAGNLPTTATIPVGLHRGWNQIGVPSLTAIITGNLSFANPTGAGAITFAQASSTTYHLVSPTLYGYNGSSYFTVTSSSAMQPWQSYWIYAFTDTTVLIPTGG